MAKFYVIIPAYNEARHIRRCVDHVLQYTKNIIVVNDGSTDSTGEIIDSIEKIEVIHAKRNMGKGYAMKIGAELAWKMGAQGIVFMDADNQHHPKHIPEFFNGMKHGSDIVIGVRLLKTAIPLYRKIGNLMMASIMRSIFNVKIPDMMCGYRAFTKKGYKKIKWTSPNYGVETETLTIIGRKRLPFETVVVDTIYWDKYKGFSIWDGLKIIRQLPYFWARPL
ncbi:MAG: Glycosyl transferase family 2 [Microgenomates group bacterium GW2011_GWA2_46_7]|nr:MAG: Glycosyl transferase family 2 [Microgenomates group bacterium GW2011_GWA2_46_7]KKU46048.1 MAG: Glycosyl transferase family 2 [Microgenomates group bacterium GW2011_GWC2_46_7]